MKIATLKKSFLHNYHLSSLNNNENETGNSEISIWSIFCESVLINTKSKFLVRGNVRLVVLCLWLLLS